MEGNGTTTVQELVRSRAANRPVYIYEIPAGLNLNLKSVGLRELTAQEELDAAKRSRGDAFKTASELVMASLAEIDGKPVSLGDGTADTAWNTMQPQARQLVLEAYQELHMPPKDAITLFRKSRKVRVG